eukprot:392392-Hanusia_phi.AAC.2
MRKQRRAPQHGIRIQGDDGEHGGVQGASAGGQHARDRVRQSHDAGDEQELVCLHALQASPSDPHTARDAGVGHPLLRSLPDHVDAAGQRRAARVHQGPEEGDGGRDQHEGDSEPEEDKPARARVRRDRSAFQRRCGPGEAILGYDIKIILCKLVEECTAGQLPDIPYPPPSFSQYRNPLLRTTRRR